MNKILNILKGIYNKCNNMPSKSTSCKIDKLIAAKLKQLESTQYNDIMELIYKIAKNKKTFFTMQDFKRFAIKLKNYHFDVQIKHKYYTVTFSSSGDCFPSFIMRFNIYKEFNGVSIVQDKNFENNFSYMYDQMVEFSKLLEVN